MNSIELLLLLVVAGVFVSASTVYKVSDIPSPLQSPVQCGLTGTEKHVMYSVLLQYSCQPNHSISHHLIDSEFRIRSWLNL